MLTNKTYPTIPAKQPDLFSNFPTLYSLQYLPPLLLKSLAFTAFIAASCDIAEVPLRAHTACLAEVLMHLIAWTAANASGSFFSEGLLGE